MNLVDRAKNIIMTPKTEWNVIAAEEPNAKAIFMGYALPLILASALAGFIGNGFLWGSGYHGALAIKWGLYIGIQTAAMGIIGLWLTAYIVDYLAPNFGSEKSIGRAMQLVAYAMTPVWVGGLLMIFPPIGLIGSFLGLYGIYLIYLGLPKIMKTAEDKTIAYMVVTFIVMIIVFAIVMSITKGILWDMMGLGILTGSGIIGM